MVLDWTRDGKIFIIVSLKKKNSFLSHSYNFKNICKIIICCYNTLTSEERVEQKKKSVPGDFYESCNYAQGGSYRRYYANLAVAF